MGIFQYWKINKDGDYYCTTQNHPTVTRRPETNDYLVNEVNVYASSLTEALHEANSWVRVNWKWQKIFPRKNK